MRIYVLYVCIILPKPSLRPPFCRFLRKKLRPRATSASTFPSPSLPSYFRQKFAADRRHASVRSRIPNSSRSFARSPRTVRCRRLLIFFLIVSTLFLFVFSLSFFLSSRSKMVGRRTRVIGQGSKTWKGYRNSLRSHCFLRSFHPFLSFVAISLLFFLSFSVLPLALFLFSSHRPREKKEIDLNVRDGR